MVAKRKHRRINIIGNAHVRQDASDFPLEAQIVNVSYGGMQILVRQPISGEIELTLCFLPLDRKDQISETMRAQVSWIEKSGLWYSVGLKFCDLNPTDHPATSAFLDKHGP